MIIINKSVFLCLVSAYLFASFSHSQIKGNEEYIKAYYTKIEKGNVGRNCQEHKNMLIF